jgi:hypothetical protein
MCRDLFKPEAAEVRVPPCSVGSARGNLFLACARKHRVRAHRLAPARPDPRFAWFDLPCSSFHSVYRLLGQGQGLPRQAETCGGSHGFVISFLCSRACLDVTGMCCTLAKQTNRRTIKLRRSAKLPLVPLLPPAGLLTRPKSSVLHKRPARPHRLLTSLTSVSSPILRFAALMVRVAGDLKTPTSAFFPIPRFLPMPLSEMMARQRDHATSPVLHADEVDQDVAAGQASAALSLLHPAHIAPFRSRRCRLPPPLCLHLTIRIVNPTRRLVHRRSRPPPKRPRPSPSSSVSLSSRPSSSSRPRPLTTSRDLRLRARRRHRFPCLWVRQLAFILAARVATSRGFGWCRCRRIGG